MRNQPDLFCCSRTYKQALERSPNSIRVFLGFYGAITSEKMDIIFTALKKRFKRGKISSYFMGQSIRKGKLFAFVFFVRQPLADDEKDELKERLGVLLLQTINTTQQSNIRVRIHE